MSWREDANAPTAIHPALEVETRVSEIGRSSFRMEYEIFYKGTDGGSGAVYTAPVRKPPGDRHG